MLIGGLLSSTRFVLTITPAAYHVIERAKVGSGAVVDVPYILRIRGETGG